VHALACLYLHFGLQFDPTVPPGPAGPGGSGALVVVTAAGWLGAVDTVAGVVVVVGWL
jgi:hypothetical protein